MGVKGCWLHILCIPVSRMAQNMEGSMVGPPQAPALLWVAQARTQPVPLPSAGCSARAERPGAQGPDYPESKVAQAAPCSGS